MAVHIGGPITTIPYLPLAARGLTRGRLYRRSEPTQLRVEVGRLRNPSGPVVRRPLAGARTSRGVPDRSQSGRGGAELGERATGPISGAMRRALLVTTEDTGGMDEIRASPTPNDDRQAMAARLIATLRLASAELQLHFIPPETVVRRAAELLADVPSDYADLAVLAGAEPRRDEVEDLLAWALENEGAAVPDRTEAGLLGTAKVCRDIVNSTLSPVEGARLIWRLVRDVPALEGELLQFVGFASEWEDSPDQRVEIESDIRQAAAEFA